MWFLIQELNTSPHTRMSTCDRISKLYDMLQAGAINADEYAALKKEAFLPRFEVLTTPQVGNATEFAKMQEQMANVQASVRSIANSLKRTQRFRLTPSTCMRSLPCRHLPKRREKAKGEPTVVRGQMSLFDVGCDSATVRPGGRKFTVNETQIKATEIVRAKVVQCRWCDSCSTHGPARASHEKTQSGPMRGQRALIKRRACEKPLARLPLMQKLRRSRSGA